MKVLPTDWMSRPRLYSKQSLTYPVKHSSSIRTPYATLCMQALYTPAGFVMSCSW